MKEEEKPAEEMGGGMLLVDSGTSVCACPPTHAVETCVERPSTKNLCAAGGEKVIHHNKCRDVNYFLEDGSLAKINYEVANVKFPMLSVAKMNVNRNQTNEQIEMFDHCDFYVFLTILAGTPSGKAIQ